MFLFLFYWVVLKMMEGSFLLISFKFVNNLCIIFVAFLDIACLKNLDSMAKIADANKIVAAGTC